MFERKEKKPQNHRHKFTSRLRVQLTDTTTTQLSSERKEINMTFSVFNLRFIHSINQSRDSSAFHLNDAIILSNVLWLILK